MWGFQILLEDGWNWVCRTNPRIPYEYKTEEEARRMLEMCYPDAVKEEVRVHMFGDKSK